MIGIITINDYSNFGNRLQNYAVYRLLCQYGETRNIGCFYGAEYENGVLDCKNCPPELEGVLEFFDQKLAFYGCNSRPYTGKIEFTEKEAERRDNFLEFNRLIPTEDVLTVQTDFHALDRKYDIFVTGSDQVWNPLIPGNSMYINMLGFTEPEKKVALAPSVAIDTLTDAQRSEFRKYLSDFLYLSCREQQGAELISEITGKECTAVVDPTLMLTADEWQAVEKRPRGHHSREKYLLLYFLGDITGSYQSMIHEIAEKYGLKVVNLLDESEDYFSCGPSEFLYLIHHAELVLTDSFHGSALSYIFDRPFRIFRREGIIPDMNTRLVNLMDKLGLGEEYYISEKTGIDSVMDAAPSRHLLEEQQEIFRNYLDKCFHRQKEGAHVLL